MKSLGPNLTLQPQARELVNTPLNAGVRRIVNQASVRVMPFYCSKRSADICVVLGLKKSPTYSSEYASGFPACGLASSSVSFPSQRRDYWGRLPG
jgi:hypothetical protein